MRTKNAKASKRSEKAPIEIDTESLEHRAEGITKEVGDLAPTNQCIEGSLGDVLEKIQKACKARNLSQGSERSAISIANGMFKKYGSLPSVEQVKADAPNIKTSGNWLWFLKLFNSQ